jgi:D-threo-aldose 1-dehydrogenase
MTIPRTTITRSGLQVTRIGLGTGFLVGVFQADMALPYVDTVRTALAAGINLIDTASIYGRGKTEVALGEALAGVPRDSYVLQTKAGRYATDDGELRYDYSRDAILRSVERSLARMRVDRLDTVLVHDADADRYNTGGGDTGREGTYYHDALDHAFPALVGLRDQGVIKMVGAGMNQWQMEWDFARNADVDCFLLAGRYTLLEQTSLGFLDYCRTKGIAVFLGGVFNSGILVHGTRGLGTYNYGPPPPDIVDKVTQIEAACDHHGVPLRVAAMHFALAHPAVTSLVLGAQQPGEVGENVAALDATVPPALWSELKSRRLIDPNAPTSR